MFEENAVSQILNSNNTGQSSGLEQNKENMQEIFEIIDNRLAVGSEADLNGQKEQMKKMELIDNNSVQLLPIFTQSAASSHQINTAEVENSENISQGNNETAEPLKANRIICQESEFYTKAQDYWSNVPPTVNGMLGGLGYISAIDIQGSTNFLRELKVPENKFALDCGAGIGRVTKNLLMPRFECVDMVEQDEKFAKTAESYCTADAGNTLGFPKRLGEIFNMGLQDFVPTTGKYDLIWSQWVLGHLTDEDLLSFFRRVQIGLKTTGSSYFVMKENVLSSSNKTAEKDETDSSVTRPLKDYENLLRKAGFKIVKTTRQQSFPKGLYPVFMIACRVKK